MSTPNKSPRTTSISKKSPRSRQAPSAKPIAHSSKPSGPQLKKRSTQLAKQTSPKIMKKSTSPTDTSATASPQVIINKEMTESKLKLLEQSPLRRLIPEADRKAAATELQAKRNMKRKSPQNDAALDSSKKTVKRKAVNGKDRAQQKSPQQSVSSHKRTASENVHDNHDAQKKTDARQNLDNLKLGVAKKKEARRMRWKVRKLRKNGKLAKPDRAVDPGVLYLGHIPHGFYEKEMMSYFSQFGEVLRVRLSRSVRTGRSRGYAFIEFAHKEVAEIAADAMDGYIMHKQKLVARFVPSEKVHAETFKGANRTFRHIPWSQIERRNMLNHAKDPVKLATRSKRILKSARRKQATLARQGLAHAFLELPRGS
ncbi:unnamed protein product [Agarophyton chilense]